MLVLSRKVSQSIMIGSEVEIFVVEIRGDKVRLGINAPSNVRVNRREVYDAIEEEEKEKLEYQRLLNEKIESEEASE